VKEIEEALLREEVDLGVHSAKDVPGALPEALALVGTAVAEDVRDALVAQGRTLDELAGGARIGTSSVRRRSQLLAVRPDLAITGLRGNVDTRLAKLDAGDYDGIVLALAGLRRLGLAERASAVLDPEVFVPAPGQGLLALEARRDDSDVADAAAAIGSAVDSERLAAERALVGALDASCHTPLGAYARTDGDGSLELLAYVGLPDGSEWIGDRLTGDAQEAASLGRDLAERLLAAGAGDLLRRAG
jgi:hydroxymethylbilane synthase